MRTLFTAIFAVVSSGILLQGCASSANDMLPCGTVAAYLAPEPQQNKYRVVVTHLDNKAVISRPTYQLVPGRYEFKLAELIDSSSLKVSLAARKTKILVIDVKADTLYHLAARFNTDKIYLGLDEDYWQPIIAAQEHKSCTMAKSRQQG
ncbi:hypothetical protein [Shewanella sp. SR44-3]|uniref:hypothetical protein n=1 Tax=unclassified Shewanella TaxID=196818 RepID=UPI0015F83F6F|nr:hypothetical protein [Shewanella sp. SR44-3]MBB1269184.1 hypothetical protein [Shewanella sp. SR44-3]